MFNTTSIPTIHWLGSSWLQRLRSRVRQKQFRQKRQPTRLYITNIVSNYLVLHKSPPADERGGVTCYDRVGVRRQTNGRKRIFRVKKKRRNFTRRSKGRAGHLERSRGFETRCDLTGRFVSCRRRQELRDCVGHTYIPFWIRLPIGQVARCHACGGGAVFEE